MSISTILPCSNTPLKEDIFVFEGKQLEKLFDLLEENLLALPDNSSCEKNLFNSSIAKQVRSQPFNSIHYSNISVQ